MNQQVYTPAILSADRISRPKAPHFPATHLPSPHAPIPQLPPPYPPAPHPPQLCCTKFSPCNPYQGRCTSCKTVFHSITDCRAILSEHDHCMTLSDIVLLRTLGTAGNHQDHRRQKYSCSVVNNYFSLPHIATLLNHELQGQLLH